MFRTFCYGAGAMGAGALAFVAIARAHVTLESPTAAVGASYKAVMRVPHGCGGTATTAIRVRIADGVVGVKPMPKPGWKLDTVNARYQRSYTLRGAKISEGVTEIAWSGGQLADAHYDEFVFTGAIAEELEPGKTIYFPVVQECEKGVERWIEIPVDGRGHDAANESSQPAPSLRILPRR